MKRSVKAELCEECKNKICLTTGRPCKKIEDLLRKEGIYSADYIRPKMPSHKRKGGMWREIPFSMLDFDVKRYNGNNFR